MSTPTLTQAFVDALARDVAQVRGPQLASARRGMYNVLSTAAGAATTRAVSAVADWAATRSGGEGGVPVPGRVERVDPLDAALLVGFAAHVDDFDDTHLGAVVHPGAAVLGAVWAAGLASSARGEEVLLGYLAGCEAQLRIKLAVHDGYYPEHEASFTGILAAVGAGVGAGQVLQLSPAQTSTAVTLALQGSAGLRASLGTMAKPLQPGRGAATGLVAALAAATMPTDHLPDLLTGPGGFYDAYFDGEFDHDLVTSPGRWHIDDVAFKPYPCGVVIHPFADAALAIRGSVGDPDDIEEIVLRCAPMVRDDTGVSDPTDELSAKFSAHHGVAVTLLDGELTPRQYDDDRVNAADVVKLRSKVRLDVDDRLEKHEGELIVAHAGTTASLFIEAARGSRGHPMTDDDLRAKAAGLIDGKVRGDAGDLWQAVAELSSAPSLAAVVACLEPVS